MIRGIPLLLFRSLSVFILLQPAILVGLPPSPVEEAETVVRLQLEALQTNDKPEADSGIATAWNYAHPDNRRATGPLDRFTLMLKGVTYRDLLDHRTHSLELEAASETVVVFRVTVVPESGLTRLVYFWAVAKIGEGERSGEWGTTAVSAPMVEETPV